MDKRTRTYVMVGGGVLLLILLYRHFLNNAQTSAQQAGTQTGASDPMAAEYASLAGQEQSDVAALQQQNATLLSTEQSDVQTLTGGQAQITSDLQGLSGVTEGYRAAEQGDVVTLGAQIAASTASAVQAAVKAVQPGLNTLTHEVAAVSAGQKAVSRATTFDPKKGGKFYDWYKSIYHKAPPAVVAWSNPIYLAYTKGVSKAQVKKQHPKGILH